MRRGLVAVLIATLVLAVPASAQPTGVASSADALTRALVGQYEAALIRERRLSDDRQLHLIDAAEARMRDARHALGAATANRAHAQAELDVCRADYLRLVESVPLQAAAARIEVEAFRAEVSGSVTLATPDLIAAYEQFADGDRQDAWTTLATLLSARAAARIAAAHAAAAGEIRQLAWMRNIMRVHGEATVVDVLQLWDQASALDPSDAVTHIHRAILAQQKGELDRAESAASLAVSTARTDVVRSAALDSLGDVQLARGDLTGARASAEEGLAISRRIATALPNNSDAQRDVGVGLGRLGNVLELQGDSTAALAAYNEALSVDRRSIASRNDARSRRDLSVSLERVGGLQTRRGDLQAARATYEEDLLISRRLAADDPQDADAQGDLSIALQYFGDIQIAQGDVVGGQASYSEMLAIARVRAAADPSNADAQRILSVAWARLGDTQVRRGDLEAARESYAEDLAISRRLAADRGNIAAQHDLISTLENLSDVVKMQTDFVAALALSEEALAVARSIGGIDPSDARAQRELWVALGKVGDARAVQGDVTGAVAPYREGLSIARRLASLDPSSAVAQRDISINLIQLGDVHLAQGDVASAGVSFEEALAISRRLAQTDRGNADAQRDVSIALTRAASVRLRSQDQVAARPLLSESLDILHRLAAAQPEDVRVQSDILHTLVFMAVATEDESYLQQAFDLGASLQRRGALTPNDVRFIQMLRDNLK